MSRAGRSNKPAFIPPRSIHSLRTYMLARHGAEATNELFHNMQVWGGVRCTGFRVQVLQGLPLGKRKKGSGEGAASETMAPSYHSIMTPFPLASPPASIACGP